MTITLAELRPHPPWRHNENDVVLVLRNPDLDEVTVTCTVTAHGYGTVFEGEPFTIAVEQVDAFDAVQAAMAPWRELILSRSSEISCDTNG